MTDAVYATTAEVAAAMGVSVSTVKRWVDSGLLPAHKTMGGHRKLLVSDVLRLTRSGDFPKLNLSLLGLGESSLEKPQSDQFYERLLRGDEEGVRAAICSAYHAGMPIEQLADEVVAPAMRGIGHQWEVGQIDVFQEHRASQACAAALHELRRIVEQRVEQDRPLAIGGAPERDFYVLPSMLAELVLLSVGWNVVQLGCNTPMASFRRAMLALQPRLVWISVSQIDDSAVVWNEYPAFYADALSMNVCVAIGGQAVDAPLRAKIPCSYYGESMTDLAWFARKINPLHPLPRRGRPALPA